MEIFIDLTRDIQAKQNFYKFRVKTKTEKQSVLFMAIDIWKDLPYSLKDLKCT